MTIGELIAALSDYDFKQKIYFEHPSHDYWRTRLATEVHKINLKKLEHSAYHSQMIVSNEDNDSDPDGTYLVLE